MIRGKGSDSVPLSLRRLEVVKFRGRVSRFDAALSYFSFLTCSLSVPVVSTLYLFPFSACCLCSVRVPDLRLLSLFCPLLFPGIRQNFLCLLSLLCTLSISVCYLCPVFVSFLFVISVLYFLFSLLTLLCPCSLSLSVVSVLHLFHLSKCLCLYVSLSHFLLSPSSSLAKENKGKAQHALRLE